MALTPQEYGGAGQGTNLIAVTCLPADANQYSTLDAAASVTITGTTGKKVIIRQVVWSYSAAPANGALTITDGQGSPTTYFSVDITAAGPGSITFDPPIAMPVSLSPVVTLADPGGAIVSKLWVNAYIER